MAEGGAGVLALGGMRKCFVGVQRWCPSTELGPTGRRFELLARGGSQGQMFDTSRPPPYTHTPPPLWSGGQEGMGWVARISPCAWASASLPCLLGLTLFLPPPQPAQFGEAAGVRRGGWQQADAGAHRGGGPHGKRLGQSAPEALAQAGSPHPRARSLAPSLPGQPLQHAGPLPRARALRPERTLRAASLFQSQASRPEQSVMQALESLTETQVSPAPVPPSPGGGPGGVRAPGRPRGGRRRAAQPSCQFGLVTQLPLPPPPSHSPPDLEGLLSHGGCHGGGGWAFTSRPVGVTLAPRSHTHTGARPPAP